MSTSALGVRVLGERLLRVGHLERVVEQHDLAVDSVTSSSSNGSTIVEAHAAGVERVVVRDLGPLEHEADSAVGQVEAHRHLGVALVGPVADAEEATDSGCRVEDVEVHALVEVRLGAELVHVLVGGFQSDSHGSRRYAWSLTRACKRRIPRSHRS